MPTVLPTDQRAAAPRQRYRLFQDDPDARGLCLSDAGLFAGAMWCADFGSDFTRRH